MGLCGSSASPEAKAEAARSRDIDKQNRNDAVTENEVVKLLLLGAGESGKSTVFKQLKMLYGQPFSQADKEDYKFLIQTNVVGEMQTLVTSTEGLAAAAAADYQAIATMPPDEPLTPAIAAPFKRLWAHPLVKATWDNRSAFQLMDSAAYFFDDIDRIAAADWEPTTRDLLLARVRTTGITAERYTIDDVNFLLCDVGGQRSERKKWINCFDDVKAVIFVAAISGYNQQLFEDEGRNRVDEACELFGEICTEQALADAALILFLNKKDLFFRKIQRYDIRDEATGRFTDYMGGLCTCNAAPDQPCTCGVRERATDYITFRFMAQNSTNREIFSHVTCATDRSNIEVVFAACKSVVLRENLASNGFA